MPPATHLSREQIAVLDEECRAAWARASASYGANFEDLTGEAADSTLDAAGVGKGTRMLDVGTGPGTLLQPALDRGAEVHAVDLTDAMVLEARRRFPGVDIRVANAAELPFESELFDVVTFGFCLHHMAQPMEALAEARRVLRPGGRVAFTVWAASETLEAFGVAFESLAEAGISLPTDQLQPPLAFGMDATEYIRTLEEAGVVQPAARVLQMGWSLDDGRPITEGFSNYAGLGTLPAEVQARFAAAVQNAVRARANEAGITFLPNPAILASACRPG
jgi:SAM-dependent methyltransferase